MNMQGLHHQQQQLAALLSVALPKDKETSSSSSSSSSKPNNPSETLDDDTSRLTAINSLHRAIVYPHNSLLVAHSASFLAQGFSQLVADKSYSVRQAAATAYGALCAVLCSLPNGRQNHVILGNLVDRFISWALPLFSNVNAGNGTVEFAAEALHEFLSVGDIAATERYALPILKACQELLEDERTSLSLLHRILTILTLISLKFFACFQAHYVDVVDLLLGWAMIPDLAEADRSVIMNSFLQFQKHWVNSLQFSLGLLSKFLGDMDVLLQDGSLGTPQQRQRLLVLLSCFSTVLQSTASGLLEINLLEEIKDPLTKMLPQLLGCLSMVGKKYGWSKWIVDSWKCLTLLAEILSERFSPFYSFAVDILFQSLDMKKAATSVRSSNTEKLTSFQVHGVLKTNLQLLSLQKLGLLSSSVHKLLQFDSPVSQLRLHPNHLVTASSAATYVFLLQHGNNDVVESAIASLLEELNILKSMLGNVNQFAPNVISKTELFALFKFDMKVLLSCVSLGGGNTLIGKAEIDSLYVTRSEKMKYHLIQNLNPFEPPIQAYVELQVSIFKMLNRLSTVEFLSKFSIRKNKNENENITVGDLRKYTVLLTQALHISSPLAVKLEALQWIHTYCETVKHTYDNSKDQEIQDDGYYEFFSEIVFIVLDAASDRESKVRCQVASVLEMFLHTKLIHASQLYSVTEVILEKLGDPDDDIKELYLKLLSHALPITILTCGMHYNRSVTVTEYRPITQWKKVFALKQLPQQLHSKQLVSILSYISQRWKVPLSSWIQRLVHTCKNAKDLTLAQQEDTINLHATSLWLDMNVDENLLERICSVNLLAGAWWAIHEAARYCITTRLRTNLGGPSQTFAALERMLLDVANVLQVNSDQSDANLNILGNSSYTHLLPLRLLLDFVESLKKNVYNAYDGSTVLPSPSRQSLVFFRANKKVCEEWFSRICEPMMNAGRALQCHDATIHYCSLRLQELKSLVASSMMEKSRTQVIENLHNMKSRFSGDILRVLRHMTLSLCKNHEPEALVGFQKWVSGAFFPLFVEENQSTNNDDRFGPLSWINGLVYQAQGQYEKAAAHFTHLLQTEESLGSMGSEGVQFAIDRIIESYSAVSDWKSLESWLSELQLLRAKHAGKSYAGALTMAGNELNVIHALAHFDDGDYTSAWACLDLTPKSSNELALDPKVALQRSEQMLLQAMLFNIEGKVEKVQHELQKAKLMLNETITILPLDGLTEAAEHVNQLHCISAFEESCKISGTHDVKVKLPLLLSSYVQELRFPSHHVHQDCKPWMKVLRVYRTIHPTSPVTISLSLSLLKLARKQKNLMLANHLNNYLSKCHLGSSEESFHKLVFPRVQYESILLLRAENRLEEAYTGLWSFISPSLGPTSSVDSNDGLKAKACLKLSSWLKRDRMDVNLENIVFKIRSELSTSDDNTNSQLRTDLIVEEIVGTTTKLSSCLCPAMGKSWISYASWCYDQAKATLPTPNESALQSCSFSPILGSEILPNRFQFTEEELSRVKISVLELLHKARDVKDSNDENYEHAVVEQVVKVLEAAAGESGAESVSCESLSAVVTSQLQKFFHFANVSVEGANVLLFNDLIDVWWSLRKRRVSLFGHAAEAYINYLSHSSSKLWGSQTAGAVEVKGQKNASFTLKATLYVLHILLNYGVELKAILEPALSTVPLLPWQEVTPQIFARLSSHPEEDVRKQLESILVMLAKQSPWSIIYPTLVDINTSEEDPSEELQRILACLNKQYPRLVQDVQLMIKELENVTVLWDELWLSTLQDLHSDVMGRINLLKEEASRIAENATLSHTEKNKINAAKYSAMMAPIVVTLDRRLASTSRKPETPHEIWFHNEYMPQIKSAISNFKTPASAAGLADVWKPFDTIVASLASYRKKSSMSLGDVAPQLALLSSSDVPMPGQRGLTTNLQGIITIVSFSQQIVILPTKTKPKKLVIVGSDGQTYPFLLKGREDLRLDARVMQLLQAINGFLHSSPISIRHYSVTPISGRAGLIQWVENVTSIYSVYKSWQTRVQAAQLSGVASGNTKNAAQSHIPRPTDMFYGKIIPALKEKGIRRVISRKDWPQDVKRKVLLDLMHETPKQLLQQEIWCASEGFKAFRSKLKRYSGSVAAMSMVGHILGLGDRHLDNILLDFHSGDIVHIDYNVCFDKGQRLKVPEIVPFRLTHTLEAALGLMGTEGSFRNNCEAVLGILKKNKDVLLMLLEVFVWDPLVEWTRGDFHDDAAIVGEERKGMELAVSLSLFASRVQEIRVPLQEHHDLLLTTLPAVESALQRFADVLGQYEIVSAVYNHTDQERSNLVLRETSAKAIVAEATNNSEKTHIAFELQAREFAQTKAAVAEKALEAATWIEQHGRIIDALRNSSIPEIKSHIQLTGKEKSLSLTSAVLSAGVPFTVVPEPTQVQCHDIDREVSQLVSDLDHGLTSAVTALHTYSLALQRILPLNYLTTSPVHSWAQILKLSVSSVSSDVLSLTRRQGAELVAKVREDGFETVKIIHNDLCVQVEKYGDEIERVEKEYQELVNSIGAETESLPKERLMATFTNFLQSTGQPAKDSRLQSLVGMAVSSVYNDVKHRLVEVLNQLSSTRAMSSFLLSELEEKIEKCVLVADWVNEVKPDDSFETNWASVFKTCVVSCKSLVAQMVENVVPNVVRSVISYDSEIMDTFGSLSQIRGSIDTALEQLIEVQIERTSLAELEQSYFAKVGFITERQLALEEAAVKGRDHLSWEEADELTSQEEACRAQLDELHKTWNQKDIRTNSLIKREASIRNALISAENHFQSLIGQEQAKEPQYSRTKALLLAIVQPFFELESVDTTLLSYGGSSDSSNTVTHVTDLINYVNAIPTYIWKVSGTLEETHLFFMWKVAVMDSFLDSCICVAASSRDQNLGFDQVVNAVKKTLSSQLQEHIGHYLRDKVAPLLLTTLDTETERLKQMTGAPDDLDTGAVERVKLMLEEYCNAHETVRAGMSAALLMKRQVKELKEGLHKTCLDIIQLEWMHDITLSPLHNYRLICHKFLSNEDNTIPLILNLSRSRLLETIQSSVAKVVRSIEGLQACEQTSVTAEGQLERAMGWACGGPNTGMTGSTSARGSGIPPEFHDHLAKRRQLLWAAREKASDMIKICMSILDFETSRDGVLGTDDRAWQQAYFNALTNLDATYHSFTRTEHEWEIAQGNMDAASNGLLTASNELHVASAKAKAASGDLQDTFVAMRDCAYEASMALSAFGSITRGHTALTSECGSMLEEVLAITKGLHDVHTLGKEASALHSSLMGDLSKANSVVLPLESVLSKDVEAMTEAMNKEKETKMEISPIHGQAIYHSYHAKIKEACHVIKPLVPSLTFSVKGLHSMLTRLARTANIHAGNLHKALEGLGESQEIRSQDLVGDDAGYDNKENDVFSRSDGEYDEELPQMTGLNMQDKGWISPPDSIYDDSSDSGATSAFNSFTGSEVTEPHPDGNDSKENTDVSSSSPCEVESGDKDASDPIDDVASHTSLSEINVGVENIKLGTQRQEEDHKSPTHNTDVAVQVSRVKSKNAYAVSVLRRVEMKIEGRDITDKRDISTAEQVDYLLRQATSVDNLCNMYEGWTPWI
ncbi:putative non-specific serine/threonine protein kinase [Helianthus annuus]|uniref:non-specific serine/threonine protein kinase n=1 Tax=Helianthus annuus TaxID=4232 RepID=A0A251V7A8_HELAN|nr:serine/threonine-protein kinase SMG1 [Helianthus annuus]KAF5814367.1 putative non-specific serine/threonine protein kinase [Helianthus annuus]KAJ0600749.1 putative non-specific serine/threonine protein kinase [Helianthus annuus]KAJ0935594.1 putative non-specific serine/threonine protein kinase [Helianthus annuus]